MEINKLDWIFCVSNIKIGNLIINLQEDVAFIFVNFQNQEKIILVIP